MKYFSLASAVSLFALIGVYAFAQYAFGMDQMMACVITGVFAFVVTAMCLLFSIAVLRCESHQYILIIVASIFAIHAAVAVMAAVGKLAVYIAGFIPPTIEVLKCAAAIPGHPSDYAHPMSAFVVLLFIAFEAFCVFTVAVVACCVPFFPIWFISKEFEMKIVWPISIAVIQTWGIVAYIGFSKIQPAILLLMPLGVLMILEYIWPKLFLHRHYY
jgi:hypothetical protein